MAQEMVGQIKEFKGYGFSEDDLPGIIEGAKLSLTAIETAIKALQPWVRTEDRAPTKEDAKKDSTVMEYVFAYDAFHGLIEAFAWDAVAEDPVRFPFWMPIPPLPEEEP